MFTVPTMPDALSSIPYLVTCADYCSNNNISNNKQVSCIWFGKRQWCN